MAFKGDSSTLTKKNKLSPWGRIEVFIKARRSFTRLVEDALFHTMPHPGESLENDKLGSKFLQTI